MRRPRLLEFLGSHGPSTVGLCQGNVNECANYVNAATERLLYAREVGQSSWWGGWAEMAFEMTQDNPYLVTPFDVTMLEQINVCTYPIPVQNEFYSYLQFGFGRFPKPCSTANPCSLRQGYDRGGLFPTWKDLTPGRFLRIYSTDAADEGKSVLVQGLDTNDQRIYSLNSTTQVQGNVYTLTVDGDGNPSFVDTVSMNRVTGIQKDETLGQVNFYEVDSDTGDSELILTMEPQELTAAYRRYFIDQLPKNCCNGGTTINVTAMAKLAYVPVRQPLDYLLIPSVEALINECQSVRYDRMDDSESKQKARYHHTQAIRLLQGQLIHEQGQDNVAINFAPFGDARLINQRIGQMI